MVAHAGVKGFLANGDERQQQSDLSRGQWEAFLSAIFERYRDRPLTLAEMVQDLENDGDFRETLPDEVSGDNRPGHLQRRLARALQQRVGRRYGAGGLHVGKAGLNRNKVTLWKIGSDEA
jgi:hypothetical protein